MLRSELVQSLNCFLSADNSHIPREDYREVAELCLLVLDSTILTGGDKGTDRQYCFRVPGAYHMARWMAKVIYCFKIYLFRNEFKLTATEAKNLTEFCLFAAYIYVPAGILCSIPSDAPINDLQLLSRIEQYSDINKDLASAAIKKFKNHLWYLGSEMVWLSLFSEKVANAEKKAMVESMIADGSEWRVRGIKYPASELEQLKSRPFRELVTSASAAALLALGMDVTILRDTEPEAWNDLPSFQEVSKLVKS